MTEQEARQVMAEAKQRAKNRSLRAFVEVDIMDEIQLFFEEHGPFAEGATVKDVMSKDELEDLVARCCAARDTTWEELEKRVWLA
jgi:hypothetical protein